MIITGIGTREPNRTQELTEIVKLFCGVANKNGWTLRSGAAPGMDNWFEQLWKGPKEIYIPRERYTPEGLPTRYHGYDGAINVTDPEILRKAFNIASNIHPNWKACNPGARALHTRNVFQIMGQDLQSNANAIVYYAKYDRDGVSVKGGTRTAVHLGRKLNIPEYNLILPDDIDRLIDFMESHLCPATKP